MKKRQQRNKQHFNKDNIVIQSDLDRAKERFKNLRETRFFWVASISLFLLLVVTIVILIVSPRASVIGISAQLNHMSFQIPKNQYDKRITRLFDLASIRSNSILIKNFNSIEFLAFLNHQSEEKNTIRNYKLVPVSDNSWVKIISEHPDIFVRLMNCAPGALINLGHRDSTIFEIKAEESKEYLSVLISFPQEISLASQECVTFVDSKKQTDLFAEPQKLSLHDISKSMNIFGKNGNIALYIKEVNTSSKIAPLLFKTPVVNLQFSRNISQNGRIVRKSEIDQLSIMRKFPFDDAQFLFEKASDIELACDPNKFFITSLKRDAGKLILSAQGKFTSFKVIQGIRQADIIPSYMSFIINHSTTSLIIAWITWILSTVIPIVLRNTFMMMEEREYRE